MTCNLNDALSAGNAHQQRCKGLQSFRMADANTEPILIGKSKLIAHELAVHEQAKRPGRKITV